MKVLIDRLPWRRHQQWLASGLLVMFFLVSLVLTLSSSRFRVRAVETLGTDGSDLVFLKQTVLPSDWISFLGLDQQQPGILRLNLSAIREKVRAIPWVDSVELSKSFPDTLQLDIRLRKPIALVLEKDGRLSYVDPDGNRFAGYKSELGLDLPLISGSVAQGSKALSVAAGWATSWAYYRAVVPRSPMDGGRKALSYSYSPAMEVTLELSDIVCSGASQWTLQFRDMGRGSRYQLVLPSEIASWGLDDRRAVFSKLSQLATHVAGTSPLVGAGQTTRLYVIDRQRIGVLSAGVSSEL